MSDRGSPGARQRRLASELRRLRRDARLTGKDVATQLGWSEAKLSRIENGQTRVKIADLDEFMELYHVSGPQRGELVALAEESREASPLEELSGDVPEGHAEILRAESEAQAMSAWEPQVVPGLLQLEDYTRAVLQPWPGLFARPAAEVERRVHEVRVLPLSGSQVIPIGAFVYFRFPRIHGVSLPDTIALEHLNGTTFVDSEVEVNTYQVVFSALRDKSLSPQASRDTLASAAREIWQ